jgi:hypothetical protein
MDLSQWLVAEFEDTVARLRGQVLDQVPRQRRHERPGGGNSILWGNFHIARHADLALAVVCGEGPAPLPELEALGPVAAGAGNGLQEAEQPWAQELEPEGVDAYLAGVVGRVLRFLAATGPDRLELEPDVPVGLAQAGIGTEGFGWLYDLWQAKPVAFFVRWPLIGHATNHVGEMIATRNRMGLSPF